MTVLRPLALCFLVSAAAFSLAHVLQTNPGFRQDAQARLQVFKERTWRPAVVALENAHAKLFAPPISDARVVLELAPTPMEERAMARVEILPPIERPGISPREMPLLDAPVLIEPSLPALPAEPVRKPERVSRAPAPLPPRSAPQVATPSEPRRSPSSVERAVAQVLTPEQLRARARMAANLTPDMRRHFDLFLFVSKSVEGPLAQRMYVFRRDGDAFTLLHDWAASTGREKQEGNARGKPSFTATPAGFYQLDPSRMYTRYRSYSWDQPMPHAMFFNWRRQGIQTGLAIHAAPDDSKLGSRASAGCVQLSPDNARTLYELVRGEYRGQVPRFSVDRSDTMSNQGRFARAADGTLRMAPGYRVLINIENYSGAGDDTLSSVMF